MNDDSEMIFYLHATECGEKIRYCRAADAMLPYDTILHCKDCPLSCDGTNILGKPTVYCGYFTNDDDPEIRVYRAFANGTIPVARPPWIEQMQPWIDKKIKAGELPHFPEFVGPKGADESLRLYQRALQYAADAHYGVNRKGTDIPYITHPIEASGIVRTMTDDVAVWAAAALHDVVEDTDRTVEDISSEFGPEIAALVADESEDKMEDRPAADTWQARKEAALAHLGTAPYNAKLIALGDKLSNLRSLCRDYEQIGAELWNRFNQKDPAKQEWYYRTIAERLKDLSDKAAYQEYCEKLELLFGTKE